MYIHIMGLMIHFEWRDHLNQCQCPSCGYLLTTFHSQRLVLFYESTQKYAADFDFGGLGKVSEIKYKSVEFSILF